MSWIDWLKSFLLWLIPQIVKNMFVKPDEEVKPLAKLPKNKKVKK